MGLVIHLPTDEHLGCVQFLAILKEGTINTLVHVLLWPYVFTCFG